MKKIHVSLIIGALALVVAAATASADVIKFQLVDLYGWGTSYSFDSTTQTYTPTAGPTGSGNGTASNPYYDLVDDGLANGSVGAQSLTNGIYSAPDGTEDGFNVSVVQFIKNETTGTTLYDASLSTYELTAFIYGYDDVMLDGNPTTGNPTNIYSTNLTFEIWKDDTPDYDPTLGTAGRSDLTDPTHFDTVTDDGSLYLSGVGHTVLGVDDAGTVFSYTQLDTFNFGTYSGTGGGLLDFLAGDKEPYYNTNQYPDNNDMYPGGVLDFADATFSFSATANYPTPPNPGTANWLVVDDTSVFTQPIPEPATMLLLGTGLVGVAGAARRKKSKA